MIPLEVDIWSSAEVGEYLKMDSKKVMERIVILPGLPQPIRIPTMSGGKGHPRWKAREVIEWVESFQERRVA